MTVIEDGGFKDGELEEEDLNKMTWTWTVPTVLPPRPSDDDGGDGHDVEDDYGDDDDKEDAQLLNGPACQCVHQVMLRVHPKPLKLTNGKYFTISMISVYFVVIIFSSH